MIAAMTDELAGFPGDLVIAQLRHWAATETFWPGLADIRAPVAREARWRDSLKKAAERDYGPYYGHNSRPSQHQKSWKDLPPERKAMINDALRAVGITEPME